MHRQASITVLVSCLVGSLLAVTGCQGSSTQESAVTNAIAEGSTVTFDYTLTVDGAVIDGSEGRKPLEYVHGTGQIVPGLERALEGLTNGAEKQVQVGPEEGYGVTDPKAFIEIARAQLPSDQEPHVGQGLQGQTQDGRPFRATISAIDGETVTLDLNHPLAGKTLNFDVTVVSVTPQS